MGGEPPNLQLPPPMASYERRLADEIDEGLLTCGRNYEANLGRPGIIGVALALAGAVYFWLLPTLAPQQSDLAIALAAPLRALDRYPKFALTPEQVKSILPLLQVLRDTDPGDLGVSRSLVEEIHNLLTPEQRVESARIQEEVLRSRRTARGRAGRLRGSLRQDDRNEFRQKVLTRLIQQLQTR